MMTYQQILELPAGAQIFKVHGTITELYGPKDGTNAKGPWSLQRGTLTFDDGQKIGLFFKDRDPIHLSAKGRRIELSCSQGQKGLSGVYADDDTHGNETKRQIKITPTGELSFIDGGQQPPPRQQQPQQPPAKTQQQAPANHTSEAPPPSTQAPPNRDARTQIAEAAAQANRIANLQLMAMETVDSYVIPRVEKRTGRTVSDQERSALTMNMIIELMRGMAAPKMPSFRLKDKAPPPPANTQQPPAQHTDLAPEDYQF